MNKVSQGVEDKFFVRQTACREGQSVWKGTVEELDHDRDAEKAGERRAFVTNHEKGVCRESLGALPAEVHKRGNDAPSVHWILKQSRETRKERGLCRATSVLSSAVPVIDESHLRNS